MCEVSTELRARMNDNTLLMDGCGCAVYDVTPEGNAVYDYIKLVEHFVVHSFGQSLDDEDAFYEGEDYISFNVIRTLDDIAHSNREGAILPIIQFRDSCEAGRVWPEPSEEDDDDADADSGVK